MSPMPCSFPGKMELIPNPSFSLKLLKGCEKGAGKMSEGEVFNDLSLDL